MKLRIIKSAGLIAAAGLGFMLVGGCASQGGSSVANSGSNPGQVCSYNSAIGSHIGARNCMSRSRYNAQQKAEHQKAQTNQDTGAGAGTGGGRL